MSFGVPIVFQLEVQGGREKIRYTVQARRYTVQRSVDPYQNVASPRESIRANIVGNSCI